MTATFSDHRNSIDGYDITLLRNRIAALQSVLQKKKIGAAWISFSRDVFYYCGTAQPSILVVFQSDHFLFVRYGYSIAVEESFLEPGKIIEERKLENIKKQVISKIVCNAIGIQQDIFPARQIEEIQSMFTGFELVNVSPLILEQRKKKDPYEVACIRQACRVVHSGYEAVLAHLKAGISELELAARVEYAHRVAGHEGAFFFRHPDFFMSTGPLASGENLVHPTGALLSLTGIGLSPAVPAGPSLRRIARGDLLIVDIPALVMGYHADQTRTYALGKAPQKAQDMFRALIIIADHLIGMIKPGILASDVYAWALEKAAQMNMADAFLNLGHGRRSHLVGHGVGLECNEPPLLTSHDHTRIEEGFVLALELHLLDPFVGAVKLEDMLLVTEHASELLTTVPRKLIEID